MTKPPSTPVFLGICAWGVVCVLIGGVVTGRNHWDRLDLLILSALGATLAVGWALVGRWWRARK